MNNRTRKVKWTRRWKGRVEEGIQGGITLKAL